MTNKTQIKKVKIPIIKEDTTEIEIKLPSYFYFEYSNSKGDTEKRVVKLTNHTAWTIDIKDKDDFTDSKIYNFKRKDFLNTDYMAGEMREYFGIHSSIFPIEITEEDYNIFIKKALSELMLMLDT